MAWSRKSAMFASLAIALYLLGLVLRNQQLVTVAVVLLSFLTWAAFMSNHADVSSSGRRIGDENRNDGVQLNSIVALRKISSSRIFEDGEIEVTLRLQKIDYGFAKVCAGLSGSGGPRGPWSQCGTEGFGFCSVPSTVKRTYDMLAQWTRTPSDPKRIFTGCFEVHCVPTSGASGRPTATKVLCGSACGSYRATYRTTGSKTECRST